MAQMEMKGFDQEFVSPEEYLEMAEAAKEDILSARIIPPPLEDDDGPAMFGGFLISWKSPHYRVCFDR